MEKENEILNEDNIDNQELNFEDLDEMLQSQIEENMSDLESLDEEFDQIGSPDALGETIKNVVWEQFLNQIAVTAGEDFIKDNRDLLNRGEKVDRSTPLTENDVKKYHLDLSKDAHIQTTENFKEGKIANHNAEIDFQQRYDDWQANFVKDADGNVVMHDTRIKLRDANGNEILGSDGKPLKKQAETLTKGYRDPFDKERNKRGLKGSAEKGTAMDETISVGTIVRDPKANAFMTEQERIEFDLSEKNLNEMDSSWNSSKGDNATDEWLDNTNANGQTPREIFDNLDEESEKKLREKNAEAKEEYEKQKKEAEEKAIETGKKSRKKEAFNIGGKAMKAAVMQLLAELVKEIIRKLILWFKTKGKSFGTLIESIKEAIHSFISKLKTHIVNATSTLITTIATAIIGPVVGTIKKAWMMLKQSVRSIKEAINFLKNPANKEMPIGLKLLEVGKIVMAGISGASTIILGGVIEKALMGVPGFAVEIPLLGSLANVIGIFMGAVVAGIIGALAIHMIDNATAKVRKSMNLADRVEKGNEVIKTQHEIIKRADAQLDRTRADVVDERKKNHMEAASYMKEVLEEIEHKDEDFQKILEDSKNRSDERLDFDSLDEALDGLFDD